MEAPPRNKLARRPRCRPGKKFWIILALVLLTGLTFNPITFIFWQVERPIAFTDRLEASLKQPEIYTPLLRRQATYCRSDPKLFPGNPGNFSPGTLVYQWFPEMANLVDCWGSIGPDAATIGMGGGFHHFGYSLVRDRTLSTSGTNVWEAPFSSEDKDDTPLANISLPVSRHFTATGIKRMLEAAADDAIRNGREDAYEDKVTMELHLGDPAAAAAACAGWVKAHPDSWLARSTHAHLCCRMGESDAAAADFAAPGTKARHKPAQGETRNERSPGLPAETGQTLKGRDNLSAQPGITYNI